MGRRYATELRELAQTYEWATNCPLDHFAKAIEGIRQYPFFAIGSGGSSTAAAFWAMLHEYSTGNPSRYGTPLELLAAPTVRPYALGLVTARGANPDITQALDLATRREPRGVVVLTYAKESSPIRRPPNDGVTEIVHFAPPVPKDGFLATNSLLASMVLLYRAYCVDRREVPSLSSALSMPSTLHVASNRATYSILYADWGKVAANDLESKLVESGLSNVHHSDLRNFAHGRHHWLSRRGLSTTIVALITPLWAKLFESTLGLLPPEVEIIRLEANNDGPLAAIELVTRGMGLIGQIASLEDIDPGRPTVPAYGRKLYHMRVRVPETPTRKPDAETLLSRKLGSDSKSLSQSAIAAVKLNLLRYLETLGTTKYQGIVFDYDGTLCPTNARFGSLPPAIADALSDIMSRGVVLGIASGRGRSVGTALRESFDGALHHKIIVGYYNGAHIRRLDAGPPEQAGATSPRLENVAALLRNHPLLPSLATFDVKMQQLTLMPMADVPLDLVHEIVTEIATAANIPEISVMRSSHSIDVLGSDISKHSVVEACLEVIRRDRPDGHVLRLGDKGNHTGNDFALLSTPHALSVADCPKNTLWAWNLAPPGHLGPHATLDYIEAMRFESGGFHIDTTSLVGETL